MGRCCPIMVINHEHHQRTPTTLLGVSCTIKGLKALGSNVARDPMNDGGTAVFANCCTELIRHVLHIPGCEGKGNDPAYLTLKVGHDHDAEVVIGEFIIDHQG